MQNKAAKKKKRELISNKNAQLKQYEEQLNSEIAYALELVQEAKFHNAESCLRSILLRYGDHAYIYYAFGLLYVSSDNTKAGIYCLEKSIELDTKYSPAYFNLAVAYYKEFYLHKMLDTLNQMFDTASYDDQMFSEGKKLLAKTEKAIKETDNISLEEYCHNQKAFDYAFSLMMEGSYAEAINAFSQVLKTTPEHVQCYGNMGICYAKLGKRDLALESLNSSLKIDPTYELAMVNKKFVENLKDGEKLDGDIGSVEYYKEFSLRDKSYIEDCSKKSSIDNKG